MIWQETIKETYANKKFFDNPPQFFFSMKADYFSIIMGKFHTFGVSFDKDMSVFIFS